VPEASVVTNGVITGQTEVRGNPLCGWDWSPAATFASPPVYCKAFLQVTFIALFL